MVKIGPFRIGLDSKDFKNERELGESKKTKQNNLKKSVVRAKNLIRNTFGSREFFEYPEHNLHEIKIASESDSYIKTALGKYSNLVFKAGYNLKGDNQKAVDYIKTRWKIMSVSTRTPMDVLFEGIAKDIITYGNCFLSKTRVDPKIIGIKANGVYGSRPVGGYFRMPPETVQIKRDENGNVIKYRQKVYGREKEYSPNDVIHLYIDKDANSAFGTPRIQAAIEDVKMLRRVEGNVLSLIYRFSMPTYQWKIGIPEPGYEASDKDIEDARAEIEGTSLDGIYITNEKTNIKAIGAEGNALNASGYLDYFESRVFSALEVSTSQMGRDSTKANADSVETQTHDTVKYIQRMIRSQLEIGMITELLLEGGFDPILKEEDEVKFVFEETSLDTKVKIENHELMKYQSNLITIEEARQAIGKEPECDKDLLYQNYIITDSEKKQSKFKTSDAVRLSKEQHKLQLDMIKKKEQANKRLAKQQQDNIIDVESDIKEKPSGGGLLGNGKAVTGGKNNAADNMARPENQHGRTSVKIKESAQYLEGLGLDPKKNEKKFKKIYQNYDKLRNSIVRDTNSNSYKKKIIKDQLKIIREDFVNYMDAYSKDAIIKATNDYYKIYGEKPDSKDIIVSDSHDIIGDLIKDLEKLGKDIYDRIVEGDINCFETYRYRIRFMIEYYMPKTFYYSYVIAAQEIGATEVEVIFSSKEDEVGVPKRIRLGMLEKDQIPAYHPFCKSYLAIVY